MGGGGGGGEENLSFVIHFARCISRSPRPVLNYRTHMMCANDALEGVATMLRGERPVGRGKKYRDLGTSCIVG